MSGNDNNNSTGLPPTSPSHLSTDNSDTKSIDSWGGGTHATMQSTLVPVPHRQRVFTCPKHGGEYDDRNALCRECEFDFYEKRAALKEQQALVQQKLQELALGGGEGPGTSNQGADSSAGGPHMQSIVGGDPVSVEVTNMNWNGVPQQPHQLPVTGDQHPTPSIHIVQQQQPLYDLQQTQQTQHYPVPEQMASMQMHQQPSPPQMMMQQQPPQQVQVYHTQQSQSQHPSTSQPSPTSHSLPPRYPGMMQIQAPTNPMINPMQQQPPHQQQQQQQQQHPMSSPPTSQPPGPSPSGGGAPPPHYWSSPPPQQNSSPHHFDALTMQIQRMQQMQDWIIWQKENENTLLKQQLEQAQGELNQLRLDNALLTEKLHQQEQRMQQELKIIKLTAMQTRQRKSSNDRQLVLAHSNHHHHHPPSSVNLMPSPPQGPSMWPAFDDPSFFQPDFMPTSSQQSAEDSAGHQNKNVGNNSNNNGLQQPHLVDAQLEDSVATGNSTLSDEGKDEGKDEFDSNSINWPSATDNNSASGRSRKSQQQKNAYKRKVGPLTSRATEQLTSSPPKTNGNNADLSEQASQPLAPPAENSGNLDAHQPVGSGNMDGQASSNSPQRQEEEQQHEQGNINESSPWKVKLRQVEGSHRIRDLDEYSLEAASIPQDIGFDDRAPPPVPLEENITFGTQVTGHFRQSNLPTTPPRPNAVATAQDPFVNSTNGWPKNLPPRSPGTFPINRSSSPPKPMSPKNRNAGVSFADDNASVGHTVASSTFGEDRIKVHKQTITDPYGDQGEYTGIILRSTGMPHGSGEMVYHEDNRTYSGEWRHGRWHGVGKASFANGDTYEGSYRFDQRHGKGVYAWSDGRVFDGQFKEDKRREYL